MTPGIPRVRRCPYLITNFQMKISTMKGLGVLSTIVVLFTLLTYINNASAKKGPKVTDKVMSKILNLTPFCSTQIITVSTVPSHDSHILIATFYSKYLSITFND